MLAYTYKGIQDVTNHNVDPTNKTYFIEHAETSASQVIVNQDRNTRLDEVLSDLETRLSGESMLPSQVGNSGKFLTTNGSSLRWAIIDALPNQNNNANKVLYTNGTNAYWAMPLKVTSTVYPTVSTDSIGSYGSSDEAARADHKHPLPVYFIESYTTAIGGETELYLTEQQYPSSDRPTGFHLYRNGLLLTPEVDYTFDVTNKKITFQKACEARENIIIVLGYLQGGNSSSGSGSGDISSILNQLLTTSDLPVMDGEVSIGSSTKAANALHRHPTDTTRAPIFSPNFTGVPTIETSPSLNDNSNKIATTEYVMNQFENYSGTVVNNIIPDQTGKANLVLSTDGEHLKWVQNKNSRELPDYSEASSGDILSIDEDGDLYWTEISSPTEIPDTETAGVNEVLSLDPNKEPIWRSVLEVPSVSPQLHDKILSNDGYELFWRDIPTTISVTSTVVPSSNAPRAYIGVSEEAARADHVHLSDDTKANIDSPEFTGTPKSPTPSLNDDSTKIATTSFVNSKISSSVNELLNSINYDNYILNDDARVRTLTNVVEKLQDFGNLDETINRVPIDWSLGNAAQIMCTHELTLEFSIGGELSSNFREVTLILYAANSNIINWPENIHWIGTNAHAPVFETVSAIVKFITVDNGSSWYGSVFGEFN